MHRLKNQIIKLIHARAMKRLAKHSKALIQAKSERREAILAGLYVERDLADVCRLCLEGDSIAG